MGQECGVGEVAFFGGTCFLCSVILTLTGTGSATVFQLLYALASATGLLDCADIKYAVFLQTVSAASTVPFIIYQSRGTLSDDLNFFLVSMMTPSIAIGSNIGQVIQVAISVPLLEIICGALLISFAFHSIFESRKLLLGCISNCWKAKNSGGQEEQEVGDVEKDEGASLIDPDVKKDSSDVESRLGVEMQPCKPEGLNSSGSESSIVSLVMDETGQASDQVAQQGGDAGEKPGAVSRMCGRFLQDFRSVTFLGAMAAFLAGFSGGVLGGLTGIRAPPVLIYFMYSGYGKAAIRSTNVTIGLASLIVRLAFYAALPGTASDGKLSWFSLDDWPLYLVVIVFSIAGTPAGQKLYGMVDAEAFRVIMAVLLILAGIAMFGPGVRDIANSNAPEPAVP